MRNFPAVEVALALAVARGAVRVAWAAARAVWGEGRGGWGEGRGGWAARRGVRPLALRKRPWPKGRRRNYR